MKWQSRFTSDGQFQTGKTPLRPNTYAREANAQSYGAYSVPMNLGDTVLAEHERVISMEKLVTCIVEQPILVPDFRCYALSRTKTSHIYSSP